MIGHRYQFFLISFLFLPFIAFACSKVESKPEKTDDFTKEIIESIIIEKSPDVVLRVEDFADIYDCLRHRADIKGHVMIVLSNDCIISSAILLPENTSIIINNCTISQEDYSFDNVFNLHFYKYI